MDTTGKKICCAGEVMVELATTDDEGLYRRDFAGDSFNTAIYLARAGLPVQYLSCLGDDPLSAAILARLQEEGIDGSLVRRLPGRQPGLYLISNDAAGERQFSYWRDNSPARELFDQPVELSGISHFYFTGISLAVWRSGLDHLLVLLDQLRQLGCTIIFDPNYRPALWQTLEQAHSHYREVLPRCGTVLSTAQDDAQLWGLEGLEACRHFYLDLGVRELLIRMPDLTTHACSEQEQATKRAPEVKALDTTGAGDAFNAGYLAARLQGETMAASVDAAQALAAQVVRYRGAIMPVGIAPQVSS